MSSCNFGGRLKKICSSVHLVRCVAKRSFCSRFFRVMAGDQSREGVYGGDLNVVLALPPIVGIYKTCYCIFSCVIGLLPKGSFWFHLYVGLHLYIHIPQAYSMRWKATHMKAWQTLWGGRRRRSSGCPSTKIYAAARAGGGYERGFCMQLCTWSPLVIFHGALCTFRRSLQIHKSMVWKFYFPIPFFLSGFQMF